MFDTLSLSVGTLLARSCRFNLASGRGAHSRRVQLWCQLGARASRVAMADTAFA